MLFFNIDTLSYIIPGQKDFLSSYSFKQFNSWRPVIKLQGTETINAPQEKVWDFIIDPEAISQCVPGLESIEVIVPNEKFLVIASIGFGSVKARFKTEVELVELNPPNRAKIKAHGTAPGSAVDAISEMVISQNEDGSTQLDWTADVVVVGTIASLASRMMGGVTKKLSGALFDCVKKKIEE